MKYVFFVTRDPWSSFNSIYAYTKIKGNYPSEFLVFYTDDKNMAQVERMLYRIYGEMKKEAEIRKVKIESEDLEDFKKRMEEIEPGDIVDITGARKIMILAVSSLKNVRIVYLYLRDMRFSSLPFMMRPLAVQSFEEVEV